MKKIFNTFIINTILAFGAAYGLIYQELGIGIADTAGMLGIGAVGAIGGSLAGEAINSLVSKKQISYKNLAIGAVLGFAGGAAATLAV